ncbi:hypothetical protein HSE3_gp042 [Bacillus phage vB_BceM-HSE3]|nr:hypothetical protein HSE3_gp042 [Bacillus phage vB_BceM-HSE3]
MNSILEWLQLNPESTRVVEFVGKTPISITHHFKERLALRYPSRVSRILGISRDDIIKQISINFIKQSKSITDFNDYKSFLDYTSECTYTDRDGNKINFTLNFAVTYLVSTVASTNYYITNQLNDKYLEYTKATGEEKKVAFQEYKELIGKHINARNRKHFYQLKLKPFDKTALPVSLFGSITTQQDKKLGYARTIKPSADNKFVFKAKLPRTNFTENEFHELLKWSMFNIKVARDSRRRDIKIAVESYTIL